MRETPFFKYSFCGTALVDIGLSRRTNQDEVIVEPELGFYGVSDGMGGLACGGKTSYMIKETFPGMLQEALDGLTKKITPSQAARILKEQVQKLSDSIYNTGNREGGVLFGATFTGMWLVGTSVVFVNLGDSRGYILSRQKKYIRQITRDHNVATMLVEQGELSRIQANGHPASATLTRFAGMRTPATPEVYIQEVEQGDRLLLCSDGLYGMVDDEQLPALLRSSEEPRKVCQRLVNKANHCGGHDNIAVVYVKII
ncbi:protein phosphatase 2C domain-containing protein [Parabacteroides sp. PF5-9]|uniref:PP2C family protein-serine/threonine phosphatase n=1 Tax=Parabacteroides sp. PF5-9 TaxID=1742404 RepID=UPI002474E933|nr:protein phosphatase 2C domain-containing protein [Parabacteroides sp. PF5-9]MDH6356410.1 serine/threonine protein phosphatase PrpC [Parabacteroides sp. PF5-9]